MVKKIKFPLEMADGVQVRTLEELKEHFNLENTLGYYVNGKLMIWLTDRYYENEANQIRELNNKLPNFVSQLCRILGVETQFDELVDLETVANRNAKIAKLKQFTDDDKIISRINSVAFNQEDLVDLLDDEAKLIYLCGESFTIPLTQENISYIGIQSPLAIIISKVPVDFAAKHITFQNVGFDEEYCRILADHATTTNVYTRVIAPINGKISMIMKKVGDKVDKGEGLMTIEAMKMQNEIGAPVFGTIDCINFSTGDLVKTGQLLAVISTNQQIDVMPNNKQPETVGNLVALSLEGIFAAAGFMGGGKNNDK